VEVEDQRWRNMVIELHQLFTLEYISQEVGVTVRQVSNWKAGEDVPKGFRAIRLYLFHAKHGTAVPVDRTVVHCSTQAK
jgi:hypothetical protein